MTQTPTQQTPTPQTPRVDSNSVLLRKMKLNVRKIEKVVKKNLGQQLTNKKDDDKNKKRLSLVLKEEELEKKKPNLLGKLGSKLKVKTGIFDSITNFMAWTFLGFVFTQIQPFLPKLGFLVGLLDGVASAIGWITTALVDTLSWFIKTGYDISDKLKGESDSIKKLPVNKELDKFTKTFDDTLDKTLKIAEDIANSNNPKSGEPPPTPPVKGAKSGGLITTRNNVPVNRPITREIKANRRTRLRVPTKQKTNEGAVGKDVGGENKVRDFYKSPRQKGGKLNRGPVESLSAASRAIRQSNSLFSDLAGSGVDIALGRKPANNVYVNTAKDVVALAQMINEKHDQRVKSNILGMAYGGTVDSSIKRISDKSDVTDLVATIIKKNVEDRVNKALSEMKTNVGRESAEMDKQRRISGLRGNYGISPSGQFYGPGGASTPDDGFADEYGNVSKIEMGGLSQAEIRDLGKIIQAEAGGENDLGKAAVMNVILNRYRLIKSGKATPSAFGISGKRAQDVTITDIIVARSGEEFEPVKNGSFYRTSNNAGQAALEKAIKAGGNDPEKLLQRLKSSGKSAQEADYVTRSVAFYNPSKTESSRVPFPTPTVSVGRHGFQHSANVKLTGRIGKIAASISPLMNLEAATDLDWEKLGFSVREKASSFSRTRGRPHTGRDIAIKEGTPLRALSDSEIVDAGDDPNGYGYYVIFREKSGREHLYAHLLERSPFKKGDVVKQNTIVGKVGSTGRSTGPHLHWEVSNVSGRVGYKRGDVMDPLEDLGYSPKLPFTGVKEQNVDKKYDIIIPLDHVPAHLKDKIPDKKGGNTFKNASQTGADGREREYTGTIANYVSASLKKQGYNVRIITPEEFGNYEDYDKFIEEHSNKGTTVLPFHLDADPKKGGIGFLARIRKDDELDRNLAQNLSPVLQKYASVFGQGQTFRVDTLSNSTINKAAKGPSALLELGSLVTLEGLFGKGFVSHPKYKEFLDELTVAITTSVTKNKSEARKAPETKKLTPMQERAKRNRERMFPTTMINPTVDEVNRRLGDLDVIRKETVDIIHKGERFTIRRNTRNDFTIYSKKFGVVDWRTFGASLRSNKPYSSPSTKPPAPKLPPAPKRPSKATSKRSSRVTPSRGTPKRPSKATPKRAWWDPRGWVGKKRGGLIGNGNQSIPSGYASYERPYGSFVVAIQPMIIQQTVPVDNPVVMPFPVATTVNSTLPQRG